MKLTWGLPACKRPKTRMSDVEPAEPFIQKARSMKSVLHSHSSRIMGARSMKSVLRSHSSRAGVSAIFPTGVAHEGYNFAQKCRIQTG